MIQKGERLLIKEMKQCRNYCWVGVKLYKIANANVVLILNINLVRNYIGEFEL